MSFDERWYPGQLRELETDECWELLDARPVGRIGYVDDHGPLVLPVTYVLDDRSIVFRTSAYTVLGRHLPGQVAAFEADEIDEYTRSGWSVVVRGRVEVAEAADLPVEGTPQPWVDGPRALYLRLVPHEVTGRRLLAA